MSELQLLSNPVSPDPSGQCPQCVSLSLYRTAATMGMDSGAVPFNTYNMASGGQPGLVGTKRDEAMPRLWG